MLRRKIKQGREIRSTGGGGPLYIGRGHSKCKTPWAGLCQVQSKASLWLEQSERVSEEEDGER